MGIMAFSESERPPDSVVHSRMAPYVVDAARAFAAMAPHDLREGFHKTYAQVKAAWGEAVKRGIQHRPDTGKEEHEKRI